MTTARKPGRPVDPDLQARRRDEILDAAVTIFSEKGYDEADTQAMADRLGVAKGTLYRYFPSKRELFQAVIHRSMAQLRAWVDEHVAPVDDPLEEIIVGMRAYLEFFEKHPEVVELLIQERARFKDQQSSYFEYRDQNDDGRWDRLVMGLIDAGRIRRMPVERIMNVLGDLVYGTMFTNHMSKRTRSYDEQARDLIEIAFFGILTEQEKQRRNEVQG
jgi:AcrR family transcriptional regulator